MTIPKKPAITENMRVEPVYLQALVDPFSTWTGYFNTSYTIKYSYQLPQNWREISGYSHLLKIYSLSENEQALTETSMKRWSSVSNVLFEKNEKSPQAYIVDGEFSGNATGDTGYKMAFSNKGIPIREKAMVSFNHDKFLEMDAKGEMDEKTWVIVHELGHLINLSHGFRFEGNYKPALLPEFEHNTTFSVMNYVHTTENGIPIFPIGPLPYDIAAVQKVFGPNINTHAGNTVHNLTQIIPHTENYMTISSLWDASGIDTLSAKGYKGAVKIDLNEGPYHRSKIGNGYLTLAFGANIENVVGGDGDNIIVPNPLDNNIDIRHSMGTTHIHLEKNAGNDIILGFKPEKDKLHTSTQVKNFSDIKIESSGSGTKLTFPNKSTLQLEDVKPEQITANVFITNSNAGIADNHEVDSIIEDDTQEQQEVFTTIKSTQTQQAEDVETKESTDSSEENKPASSLTERMTTAALDAAEHGFVSGIANTVAYASSQSVKQAVYYSGMFICNFAHSCYQQYCDNSNDPEQAVYQATAATAQLALTHVVLDQTRQFLHNTSRLAEYYGCDQLASALETGSKHLIWGKYAYKACIDGASEVAKDIAVGVTSIAVGVPVEKVTTVLGKTAVDIFLNNHTQVLASNNNVSKKQTNAEAADIAGNARYNLCFN